MFKKKSSAKAKTLRKRGADEGENAASDTEEPASSTAPQVRKKRRETGGLRFKVDTGLRFKDEDPAKAAEDEARELEQRRAMREQMGDASATFEERKPGDKGPKPPSKYLRKSLRVVNDFKPSICKPYYQNGWCKWGDTCKYAHITEAYANEAELDAQWERKQAGGDADSDSDSESSDDGLTCPICSNRFNDPVVTRYCRHVFCGDCALQHDLKMHKCYVCHRPTNGIFNNATAMAKQLKLVTDHEEMLRKREEEGVGSDDDSD